MFEQAKVLETKMYSSDIRVNVEPSEIFYSTILETKKILIMLINSINESREELLINGFVNEYSLKLLPMADSLAESINHTLDRGVQVKSLMSFEYDNRPLSENQKIENKKLIKEIKNNFNDFGLSTYREGFDLKFTFKRFPNCYDIIDRERVIMKLQNPSASWQIFACLNIVDPLLATELRKKFLNVWQFDTIS